MRTIRNLIFLMVAVASLASATVTTFSDRSTWEAATTSRIDVDFESLGLGQGGYQGFNTAGGLSTGGLTFLGVVDPNTFWLYALNPGSGDPQNFGSSTLIKLTYGATAHLAVNTPTGTTSFAMDLMTAFPEAQSFRIQLDGIDVAIVTTLTNPNRQFFGVTSDTAFSQVRIYFNSGNQSTLGLYDNFAYGLAGTSGGGGGTGEEPPPETPEVATLLSVGSGLVMMRWMRRRQPCTATPA